MTIDEAIFCEKSYIGETDCRNCNYYGTDTCKSRESHKMAIKALEQEPRWIPCSKKMPKENEYVDGVCRYYLIQDEYGDMHVAHRTNTGWRLLDSLSVLYDNVVAWRPLPEIYRAESDETPTLMREKQYCDNDREALYEAHEKGASYSHVIATEWIAERKKRMRPIDADDLIKAFEALDLMSGQYAESFTNLAGNRSMEIECAENYINNAKTIDSAPIIHAHWIREPEDTAYENVWTCSNCGEEFIQHRKPKFRFCPNCGAKMGEGE